MSNGTIDYHVALAGKLNVWVPACVGHETPTKYKSGKTLLYCYNFALGKHAYLDCGTDMILTDEEALLFIS